MPGGNGRGQGKGRGQGNRPGFGPQGNCVCPKCGNKIIHQRGTPCYNENCPNCGTKMVRE